jgi:hypothetical protein
MERQSRWEFGLAIASISFSRGQLKAEAYGLLLRRSRINLKRVKPLSFLLSPNRPLAE